MVKGCIAIIVFFVSSFSLFLFYSLLIDGFYITNRKPDEFQDKVINECLSYSFIHSFIMATFALIDNSFLGKLILFVVISGISFILSSYLVLVDFNILSSLNVLIDDKSKNTILKSVVAVQELLLTSALTYQIITNHFSSTVVLLTLFPILLIMILTTAILGICLMYLNQSKEKKMVKQ